MAPDSYSVHQVLAESYLAQENRAKAEKEYRAALQANPPSVEILGDLNRTDFEMDEAETHYSRTPELAPHDYDSTGAAQVAIGWKVISCQL
jgi:tetratricopeptide (TPR) repeat protein